ncbi:MAG: hypothetical protein LBK61_02265 [Spirochaetaceae bacterium]|jgi:hypothetical protein|nr:hypothetical protein [Spirochaetaceae bacterium]
MIVKDSASVQRIIEAGERNATVLETGKIRVIIDDEGGMVPELSTLQDWRTLNAHWIPYFRANTGVSWDEKRHRSYWKSRYLYHMAGGFPCLPNFGEAHIIDGGVMPAKGWTASECWRFEKSGIDENAGGAAWAMSSLSKTGCGLDLSFSKIDAVFPGSPVHYTSIRVTNNDDKPAVINAGWQSTIGAPFLQAGCRISACATRWVTPPPGTEWDETGRLAPGTEFASLYKAPLALGGRCDISAVPGLIGYSDFVAGAVSDRAFLGWFSVVNTAQKLVYLNFFIGPMAAGEDDIVISFNNLWMQYGGRSFTPWSLYDGGTDQNFCLGLANSVSALGGGLEYARQASELLDNPATVTIPPHEARTLRYGSLFAPYENNILDDGITAIEAEANALVCIKSGTWNFPADPSFSQLKKLETACRGPEGAFLERGVP